VNPAEAVGDVHLRRGGADYHEARDDRRSGTAASRPIGHPGVPWQCPILIGAKPVPGPWNGLLPRHLQDTLAQQPQQVFSDGQMLNEAPRPNTPLKISQTRSTRGPMRARNLRHLRGPATGGPDRRLVKILPARIG